MSKKSQKNSKKSPVQVNSPYIHVEILLQFCSTTIDTIEAVSKYSKDLPSFAHGDIKPENILFKIDLKKETVLCHLIDFGTSGPDENLTESTYSVYGFTTAYLSPNRVIDSLDLFENFDLLYDSMSLDMQNNYDDNTGICDLVTTRYSTKFGNNSNKRIFGQADDLWALSMTALECVYRIHPVLEKAIDSTYEDLD